MKVSSIAPFLLLVLPSLGDAAHAWAEDRVEKSEDTVKFVRGIIDGLSDDYPAIGKCLEETERVDADIAAALVLIMDSSRKHVQEGLDMLKNIWNTKILPNLRDCKSGESEISRIKQILEALQNPHTFVMHIGQNMVLHGKVISKDVHVAVQSCKGKDFERCGRFSGRALGKLIIGMQEISNVQKKVAEEIMQSKLLNNTACVDDTQELKEALSDAAEHLMDKQTFQDGFMELVHAIGTFVPKLIHDCLPPSLIISRQSSAITGDYRKTRTIVEGVSSPNAIDALIAQGNNAAEGGPANEKGPKVAILGGSIWWTMIPMIFVMVVLCTVSIACFVVALPPISSGLMKRSFASRLLGWTRASADYESFSEPLNEASEFIL